MSEIFPEPIRNLPEADIPLSRIKAYLSQAKNHQNPPSKPYTSIVPTPKTYNSMTKAHDSNTELYDCNTYCVIQKHLNKSSGVKQ